MEEPSEQVSVLLNSGDLAALMRPVNGKGGFQSLLRDLRRNQRGNVLRLTPKLRDRIGRYATKYGDGGFERRLRRLVDATCRPVDSA